MEGRRIKDITRGEATILLLLVNRGVKRAKEISKILQIDISYTYKILNSLIEKGLITKNKCKSGDIEFKAKEEVIY